MSKLDDYIKTYGTWFAEQKFGSPKPEPRKMIRDRDTLFSSTFVSIDGLFTGVARFKESLFTDCTIISVNVHDGHYSRTIYLYVPSDVVENFTQWHAYNFKGHYISLPNGNFAVLATSASPKEVSEL